MKKIIVFGLFVITWILMFDLFLYTESLTPSKDKIKPTATPVFTYQNDEIIQRTISATAEITIWRDDQIFGCTGYAYKREADLTYFILDAHCVSRSTLESGDILVSADYIRLELSDDLNSKHKDAYLADLVAVGYQPFGDDLAIVSAKIDKQIPLLVLSEYLPRSGECVFNVSFPMEADGNLFFGSVVSSGKDETYPEQEAVITALYMGIKDLRGASGSAMVSCTSGQVFGTIYKLGEGEGSAVAIPSKHFKQFEGEVKDGIYPYKTWFKGDHNLCPASE